MDRANQWRNKRLRPAATIVALALAGLALSCQATRAPTISTAVPVDVAPAAMPSAVRVPTLQEPVPPTPVPTWQESVPPTPAPTPAPDSVTPVLSTVTPVAATAMPAPATEVPPPGGIWQPALNTSWQWMIDHPLDVNDADDMGLVDASGTTLTVPAPSVYDIDGFFNGQDPNCNIKDKNGACVQGKNDAVAQLHAMGKKVICYIDVGAYEKGRPDAYKFPASVIGSPDKGWRGSYWLDIRQTDILGPIMKARMQMCKDKGFDAIEPDEIDGYSNDKKFDMTYADQIKYNKLIADMAHGMGMSIGLKGDIDQVKDLVGYFDWTLNEECFQYKECNLLEPFSEAGKAVLQVEYEGSTSDFCPTANANNWNSMLMPLELDGGREPCR